MRRRRVPSALLTILYLLVKQRVWASIDGFVVFGVWRVPI